MPNPGLHGLYAITDARLACTTLLARTAQALVGGARLVQYRDKSREPGLRARLAHQLKDLCRQHAALFIINDDVELAIQVNADGVHLGREDMAIEAARMQLGAKALIGVSCYNDLDRALTAQQQGADYVAFGRFYPSTTKPEAIQAETTLLTEASRCLRIPVCAIGGITLDDAPELIAAGADMLAVCHGLLGAADVRDVARHFSACFATARIRPLPETTT